ncbi:MAG: hypothetical protein IJF73_00600 [Clostridia bacterium]|nr:hypothetical protein [Clostridia bacterium]
MKVKTTIRSLWAVGILCLALLFTALPAAAAEAGSEPATTAAVTAAVDEAPEGEGGGAPLSAAVAEFFRENSAELISGATFALTLFLGLLFRKKLVPGLLEALSGLLGRSREACEMLKTGHAEERRELERVLARAEEILEAAKAAAARAEEVSESIRRGEGDTADVRRVLGEQADLLYTLLMSASLPQYQKDRIGEAHAASVRALTEKRDV